ncbi:MAG: tripartite tricarboxylate transporter TctB family protein [Geminicoccaceae bacterium]|nr:tripartite tricarboxylate transporter TctB family protein [Geminicoccaceae bacterium]MCX8101287.1 tripartite tricarboxylate transporter TctB family protein [Geminicoccaceae bacterium]MDW8368669.1 tripartite tricarboxylate transporter TctB family protein [Geminicoccaceae bacterium]
MPQFAGGGNGINQASVEVAVALLFAAVGGLAIWEGSRLGNGWGFDGPEAGYFPFWIGVLLVFPSVVTLVRTLRDRSDGRVFVTWPRLFLVAQVLIPAVLYGAAIFLVGIYVASAALVLWFMRGLGGFSLRQAVPVAAALVLTTFLVFELWFLVPLPKGPVEHALGF